MRFFGLVLLSVQICSGQIWHYGPFYRWTPSPPSVPIYGPKYSQAPLNPYLAEYVNRAVFQVTNDDLGYGIPSDLTAPYPLSSDPTPAYPNVPVSSNSGINTYRNALPGGWGYFTAGDFFTDNGVSDSTTVDGNIDVMPPSLPGSAIPITNIPTVAGEFPGVSDADWTAIWTDFAKKHNGGNPYMTEFLLKDKALEKYYRAGYEATAEAQFRRNQAAAGLTVNQVSPDTPLASIATPSQANLQVSSDNHVPPNVFTMSTMGFPIGSNVMGMGTRPLGHPGTALQVQVQLRLRSLLRAIDSILALGVSLVSPPWLYVWLAAYLMNESNRV